MDATNIKDGVIISMPFISGSRILRIEQDSGEVWVLVELGGMQYEWRKVRDAQA